jgi:hypothetical protein
MCPAKPLTLPFPLRQARHCLSLSQKYTECSTLQDVCVYTWYIGLGWFNKSCEIVIFVTKATPLRVALNIFRDFSHVLTGQCGVPQYISVRSEHIRKLVEDNVTQINQIRKVQAHKVVTTSSRWLELNIYTQSSLCLAHSILIQHLSCPYSTKENASEK